MLPFAQPSWFRKFGKWSTQMSVASRVLLISMPLPGFFASKFRSEISTTWSLPPMKECVLQVSPTIPSTSWCCGACLYPTTIITWEKNRGFGIPRLLGMEWNLGVWRFFFRGCKKKSIQKIGGVGWRISESLRFGKNGWTWQSFMPFLEWLRDPFKG